MLQQKINFAHASETLLSKTHYRAMIHTILIVLRWFFLELLVPCSTHSLTEPFPPGFEPKALFGRLKPFFTMYEERQTTCSLCLLCCHYLWYKMFADCWSLCSVQAALPGAIVMGTALLRTRDQSLQKNNNSPGSQSLFVSSWVMPNNFSNQKSNRIVSLASLGQ